MLDQKRFLTKKVLRVSRQSQIPLFTDGVTQSVKGEPSGVNRSLGRY